jgi:trans-aconitate 2-methyltransferase
MNNHKDWDPNQYLKFRNERTQPSIDLVNRISIETAPEHIVDIGCGPGNSTQVLLGRWPESMLTGIDSSPAMIEKAKKNYPLQKWVLSDAMQFDPGIEFDLIFSNATIQWISDQATLFERFHKMLSPKGIIAIQIPKFQDMSLGKIIRSVSEKVRWKKATEGCSELFTYHDFRYYYDLLSVTMRTVDMWETDYIHIMASHASILDWTRSTGLKPYLDRIDSENDKKDFEHDLLDEIVRCYPAQGSGKVLFPFKRLFFIGYKYSGLHH